MCIIHGKMHVTSGDKISEIVGKILEGQVVFLASVDSTRKLSDLIETFFLFIVSTSFPSHVQVSARTSR